MKRMFGGILMLVGIAITGMSAYSVLITHDPLFGYDAAYVGAAGLAAITAGVLSLQK
ncbi:MAG TPA: hypothetical protein VGJ05_19420 [Fimbriiglobus sp.]